MNLITGFERDRAAKRAAGDAYVVPVGRNGRIFAEPETLDDLTALVRRCHEEEAPVRLLGQGSNILVRDEGVPGLVLHLSPRCFAEFGSRAARSSPAAARWGRVVTTSVHGGLAGLETLIGIPGTVGGALHGNAVAHGGNIGNGPCKPP